MTFRRSSAFKRAYKRFSKKLKEKLKERLEMFVLDEFDAVLNNHKLSGEYEGYRSINVTGDYRLVYRQLNKDTMYFLAIGTHSELYD